MLPFPATRRAALERIAAFDPQAYARSRSILDGAVSGLSPYLAHGIVDPVEVIAGLAARHPLSHQHPLVYELGWREYFRHVWAHRGSGILAALHPGPMPEAAYQMSLPADIRAGRSGVPVIDAAVRALYANAYLHHQARMWLASYIVHVRHVHWRVGADWMIAHLLDGDLASNHLSWQWVAGTASSRPYLFNAEQVAKYAPAAWHSFGSVLDTSYAALARLSRGTAAPPPAALHGEAVSEPPLLAMPPAGGATSPTAALVAGRDVWLVHPWGLGEPPSDLPQGCLRLGWWPLDYHRAWPWRELRWAFAATRMQALAPVSWSASSSELAHALQGARSVQTWLDPHVAPFLPGSVCGRAKVSLFRPVAQPCQSFSQWWRRSMGGIDGLHDLPGLAGQGGQHAGR